MGKKIKLPKERLPQSTRTHQIHKSVKDYDRKDDSWKKETES